MSTHELRSGGVFQHQTRADTAARRKRFEEEVRLARRKRDHLWIAAFAYRVAMPLPAETVMFDLENLITGPEIGCFICEQPYTDRLANRPCPGDCKP